MVLTCRLDRIRRLTWRISQQNDSTEHDPQARQEYFISRYLYLLLRLRPLFRDSRMNDRGLDLDMVAAANRDERYNSFLRPRRVRRLGCCAAPLILYYGLSRRRSSPISMRLGLGNYRYSCGDGRRNTGVLRRPCGRLDAIFASHAPASETPASAPTHSKLGLRRVGRAHEQSLDNRHAKVVRAAAQVPRSLFRPADP